VLFHIHIQAFIYNFTQKHNSSINQQILKVVGVPVSTFTVVPLPYPAIFFSQTMDEILGPLLKLYSPGKKFGKSSLLIYAT
jgi:hypothetical protein